jgi:hypothetical protein
MGDRRCLRPLRQRFAALFQLLGCLLLLSLPFLLHPTKVTSVFRGISPDSVERREDVSSLGGIALACFRVLATGHCGRHWPTTSIVPGTELLLCLDSLLVVLLVL